MLGDEHACRETFGRVAGEDGDLGRAEDRTAVEVGGDFVHRAAGDLVAGREHGGMGAKAGIVRKERGVDVDHPPGPALDELAGQDTHEAGEGDDVD